MQTAIAPQAYLCGQRSLRQAKNETLILAAKQIQTPAEKMRVARMQKQKTDRAGAFAPSLAL
ncbi:hypothetical protein [uncultured Campylobacter sp.]|uniref:hypothetical protein n=1 Tax=uncultured Campylobacter sp. TaxID=218934 RepID=UPI002625C198|nr:hypothetical protein [uncultured Campylobacter sp.]